MGRAKREPHDVEMRLYLLGRLPEEKRDRIQQTIFEDDSSYERMLEAEQDLIDDYARGRLSSADARDVEANLLQSDEQRHALRVAQGLWKAERERDQRLKVHRSYGPMWAIAAVAAVAALGVASWLAGQNENLRTQLATAQKTLTNQPAASPEPAVIRPQGIGAVASLVLRPELRGAADGSMSIPKNAAVVKIELSGVQGFDRYSVHADRGGEPAWTRTGEAANQGTLTLWVPSAMIPAGNYEFLVYGRKGNGPERLAGAYNCRVDRTDR